MVAFFVIAQSPHVLRPSPIPARRSPGAARIYRTGFGSRGRWEKRRGPWSAATRRSHAIARRHLHGAAAEKHYLFNRHHGGALTPPSLRGQDSAASHVSNKEGRPGAAAFPSSAKPGSSDPGPGRW